MGKTNLLFLSEYEITEEIKSEVERLYQSADFLFKDYWIENKEDILQYFRKNINKFGLYLSSVHNGYISFNSLSKVKQDIHVLIHFYIFKTIPLKYIDDYADRIS